MLIAFLPIEVVKAEKIFLQGDFEIRDDAVVVYGTRACASWCKNCVGVYSTTGDWKHDDERNCGQFRNWVHFESTGVQLSLQKLIVEGEPKKVDRCSCIVIYYKPDIFAESGTLLEEQGNPQKYTKDHFMMLITKLRCRKKKYKPKRFSDKLSTKLIKILTFIVFCLSVASAPVVYFKNYSTIAEHIDNYMRGLLWVTDMADRTQRQHIKKLNFLLSIIADILCGQLFLNWLTSQVSPDSFPEFFLWTVESIGQSLRGLIQWLTGDPAGFKLNYTFSKILATFTVFYIDIWCVFIEFLKPSYKIIFHIFLILGRAGITFQVSVVTDLLIVVSFHIYSICVYAARLYDIQVHALLSLWRLIFGRKKNPLRKKVDSCKYSPEQLFIGTVGFTILLFLLPTTLIYYVVFTFMRILIVTFGAIQIRIRYFVHSLPIYSTILWLLRSPKLRVRTVLIPSATTVDGNCLIFHVKPVSMTWCDSMFYYKQEFMDEPQHFKIWDFLLMLLTGKLK